MAPPTLESLPDEILVQIARMMRDEGQVVDPDRIRRLVELRPQNVASLCLTSRRLNAPATQALYEDVHVPPNGLRNFFMAIKDSRAHSSLVKTLKLTASQYYKPWPNYYHSPQEVESLLKSTAEAAGLPCVIDLRLPAPSTSTPSDPEQMIILSVLKNVQHLHLALTNRDHGWCSSLESRLSSIKGAITREHVVKVLSLAKVGHITLSVPYVGAVDMSVVIPFLSAPCLQHLELVKIGCIQGTRTRAVGQFEQEFKSANLARCTIRQLTLTYCSFAPDHLDLLASVMPELRCLRWRIDGNDARGFCTTLQRTNMALSRMVATLLQRRPKLELLSLGQLALATKRQRMTPVYEDETLPDRTAIVATSCDAVDFSLSSALKVLDVPSSIVTGSPRTEIGKDDIAHRLPPTLESFTVYMHDFRLYATPVYLDGATVMLEEARASALERAVMDLLHCLNKLRDGFDQLKTIKVVIPACWPILMLSIKDAHKVATLTSGRIGIQSKRGSWFWTLGKLKVVRKGVDYDSDEEDSDKEDSS